MTRTDPLGTPPLVSGRNLTAAVSIALALAPPLWLGWFLATTGANAVSNDYQLWVPLIDRIASGGYAWSGYFKDTLQAGCHSFAVPIVATLALARLFDWSMDATLALGLALAVLKLVLLHDALTHRAASWVRWAALPVLSALVFSPAHINVFSFGFAATHIGFTELGFALSIWGPVRFPGRWAAVIVGSLGALIAAWSWGSGLGAWPILAIALAVLGTRRPLQWLFFAALFAAAIAPYVLYGDLQQTAHLSAPASRWVLLEAVGWPFSGRFDPQRARWAGLLGLSLVASAAGLVLLRKERRWTALVPGLMPIGYGLGLSLVVAALRGQLATWYTSSFVFVWIGLVGLAVALLQSARKPQLAWCGLVAVAVPVLLATNGGFESKAFYLYSRGPAAESCLRHYRTAPSYCELMMFQSRYGRPEDIAGLAEPLERHRWGPFGADQQWTLQGDYLLDSVEVDRAQGAGEVRWVAGWDVARTAHWDFRHLDLLLPSPSTIRWDLEVPLQATTARLKTAAALSEAAGEVAFQIWADHDGEHELIFEQAVRTEREWRPIAVPLKRFAGKRIVLTLTSVASAGAHPAALFRYPTVDLELGGPLPPEPPRLPPAVSAQDRRFDLEDPNQWLMSGTERVGAGRWKIGLDPFLIYKPPIALCMEDHTHLAFTAEAAPEFFFRVIQLFYQLPGDGGFSEAHSLRMSLYPGKRSYALPLKWLGMPPNARWVGLRLDLTDGAAPADQRWFELSDLRLIRRPGEGSRCSGSGS